LLTLNQRYSVKSIAFSSFIAINNGNSFNVYNNYSKFARFDTLTGHNQSVESLAIIPSNENIVSGSRDNTVKIWNSTAFRLKATLENHTHWVNALAIIPSNENIVSGSNDKTIKVWNSKKFILIKNLKELNKAD
jgi:WD40 repeat protein